MLPPSQVNKKHMIKMQNFQMVYINFFIKEAPSLTVSTQDIRRPIMLLSCKSLTFDLLMRRMILNKSATMNALRGLVVFK